MFYWMDYFFEQSFEKNNRFLLLNKRFYWTNDFTEWSLSEKTNENIENFGNERNHILLTIKKPNKMDCSRTKNERNEKRFNMPISRYRGFVNPADIEMQFLKPVQHESQHLQIYCSRIKSKFYLILLMVCSLKWRLIA